MKSLVKKIKRLTCALTEKQPQESLAEPVLKGDKVEKIIGNVTDITESELVRDELLAKSEKISTLFNAIKDAIFVHPLKQEGFALFVEANAIACEQYGYTHDELLHLSVADITVKPDINAHADPDHRDALLEKGQIVFETFHVKKSGETFPVEINSNIFYQNETPYILSVVRDVTDRKIAEQTLQEKEQTLRNLFDHHAAVKLIIDPDTGQIFSANKAAEAFYGWPRARLEQMNIDQINLKSRKELKKLMEKAREQRRIHFDFQHRLANGSIRNVEVFSSGVDINGQKYLHSIIHDITEQKKVEKEKEELRIQNWHLKKTEGLSRMAGAIAHHFNNHLMAIMGNMEICLELIKENESPLDNLTKAMSTAQKASNISGLMLTYLGQDISEKESVDLSRVCDTAMPLLRASVPKNIVIEAKIPSLGPMIFGNKNQIQQLVTNLVTNAAEAYEEKGTVYLGLEIAPACEILSKHRFPVDWKPDRESYACVEVADLGCGIDKDNIEKIFDPFFSTKAMGRGLDLPVVLGIAKTHNSVITVESKSGQGSSFKFFIPVDTVQNSPQPDGVISCGAAF